MIATPEVINPTLVFWGVIFVLFLAADVLAGRWSETVSILRRNNRASGTGLG